MGWHCKVSISANANSSVRDKALQSYPRDSSKLDSVMKHLLLPLFLYVVYVLTNIFDTNISHMAIS